MPVDLKDVIKKVLAGDKEAFRHVIKVCNQPLYRAAIVILKNEADAEDVLQSTYLKAYQHLSSFRGESSFVTWITRILINECNMLRRKRKVTTSLEEEEVVRQESSFAGTIENLDNVQMQKWLERAVLELPEKYRIVYVIREVNELSTRKAADVLGLTEENIKVRLHRAKTLLRENLLQQISPQELFVFGNKRCDNLMERTMSVILSGSTAYAVDEM